MATKNEELYDDAEQAITDLFSDLSVSKDDAIANLEDLRSHIDVLIQSLESDKDDDEDDDEE